MLVKVFESEDMPSALKKVKETLGSDALILSTRTVRKGMGVFRKPLYEVTAAIDDPAGAPAAHDHKQKKLNQPVFPVTAEEEEPLISYQDIWKQRKVVDPLEDEIRVLKSRLADQDMNTVRREIDELKTLVRQMADAGARPAPAQPALPMRSAMPAPAPDRRGQVMEMSLLREALAEYGIESDAVEAIEQLAWENLSPQQLQNPQRLREFFKQTVQDLIRVTEPVHADRGRQRRVALIGPTGVGKTTTVAKLAANYLLNGGTRIALVTIDTYRIAAVEQLKVYGEIMNLPVEVVLTPDQLQEAFARHQDKDLILIDTAGRSPRDVPSIEELCRFLGPQAGTENHLVLAAPTRDRELQETVSRFGKLPLHSLVFTKLDECDQRGSLFNVPLRQNLPISYLTNGQRVPEDLVVAEPEALAGFITNQTEEKSL
ncbi:MAG: flagellar biosynthesis protein FlhF [Syntrophotaleaceae bacterium]